MDQRRAAPRLKIRLEQTFGKIPYTMMAAQPPLSVYARIVFAALDWHGPTAWPSDGTLARMAGCSRRQVVRARAELQARGFIRKASGGFGRSIEWAMDQQPQGLVWIPMSDGHRLRHEREDRQRAATSASPAHPHASRAEGYASPAHPRGLPTPVGHTERTSFYRNSGTKRALSPGEGDPDEDLLRQWWKVNAFAPRSREALHEWAIRRSPGSK
jgi:DNA-binding transcriptional MocR family regulator